MGLLKILKDLKIEEFKEFKWHLEDRDFMKNYDYKSIAAADLENADRMETVDLMVNNYELHGAVKVTKEVLKEIPRMDLLQNLSASSSESEGRSVLYLCISREKTAGVNWWHDTCDGAESQ